LLERLAGRIGGPLTLAMIFRERGRAAVGGETVSNAAHEAVAVPAPDEQAAAPGSKVGLLRGRANLDEQLQV
jgi:hypothetical protein